jgi:hypothetical protein
MDPGAFLFCAGGQRIVDLLWKKGKKIGWGGDLD